MSLSLEPTSDNIIPNATDERPPEDTPPSSVVTPNVDHDPEHPSIYNADAPEHSEPFVDHNNDHNMDDASPEHPTDAIDDHFDQPQGEDDVQMAEEPLHTNGVNGHDAHILELDAHSPHTPNLLPMSPEASTSYLSPNAEHDDDHPPPAKRPRVHSDADKASLANSATPPPDTAAMVTSPPPFSPSSSQLSPVHHRFMFNCIKSLKKQKDAAPFLRPVDAIALNIPHYPTIITHPMDLSTVERKVLSSNPVKPDPNPSNPRYSDVDEFIADVRLVFSNCYKFNGPDHAISAMGKRVEEVFERQIKNMPSADVKPVIKKSPPPPPAMPVKKAQPVRRTSTSNPVSRPAPEPISRPKREPHPHPPPPTNSFSDSAKKRKSKRAKDDGTQEQLRFCSKLITELFKKQHYEYTNPFYEPVDWVKLNIPMYPKIVKKPMDLSTMRKKLDAGDYPNAQKFGDDFRLMIRNCFNFNPSGTPVYNAGVQLQQFFEERWQQLPEIRHTDASDDDDDDSEDDYTRAIQELESEAKAIQDKIASLKAAKAQKEKKKKLEKQAKAAQAAPPAPRPPPKAPKPPTKKSSKLPKTDESPLTFSQKKDLSEAIQNLEGQKLERVIKIIHEGFPEIRDSTEEIEIEIDRLPGPVLTKLYNFVIRPTRPPSTKRSRHGKGTGTGGLKRKSMDEDVEAEKIRQLEQRMQLFDQVNGGAPVMASANAHSDSDSSSGSDSSGSDSE